jgi:hypothetical protein
VLYADGANGQDGWQIDYNYPGDARNQVLSANWINRAAAADGVYGVTLNVVAHCPGWMNPLTSGTTYKPRLCPTPGDDTQSSGYHYRPDPQQTIMSSAMIRMTPGANTADGAVWLTYREWDGNGNVNQFSENAFGIPNDGEWHLISWPTTAHGNVATATTQVEFCITGSYDVGWISARDSAAGTDFLRSTNFEKFVLCTDVCDPGTEAYDSIATYTRRDDILSNPDIVDYGAPVQAYLADWFVNAAVPLYRPKVELTHEAVQVVDPGSGMQTQVSGTGAADIVEWPAKTTYSWEQAALKVSLELSSQHPTWAKLLLSAASGGGSSVSSIAAEAAAAAGSGNGSPGGSSVGLSSSVPSTLGAGILATAGTSTQASASDHVHEILVDEFNIDGGNAFSVYSPSLTISGGGA